MHLISKLAFYLSYASLEKIASKSKEILQSLAVLTVTTLKRSLEILAEYNLSQLWQ